MNERATMRGDNDKENQKYSHRNLSQCYLSSKIFTKTGLPSNPRHRSKRRRFICWASLSGILRRVEEDVNLHQHRCYNQIYRRFFILYLLSFILYARFLPFLFSLYVLSFLFPFLPPYKSYICVHKALCQQLPHNNSRQCIMCSVGILTAFVQKGNSIQ